MTVNTRIILITLFVLSIFFIPIVEACFIVNDLGITSCAVFYRCACEGEGNCYFFGDTGNPFDSVAYGRICEIAWITYDGTKPTYYWENYPNAYAASIASNSVDGPKPPSSYNGKPCEVRAADCIYWPVCFACIPYTDCWYNVFEGVWDYSERGCSDCDGKTEKQIHFGIDGAKSRDRCETACGTTDARCDEIPPGGTVCKGSIKRTCDSNCNFVSDSDCRDLGSHYICSNGRCILDVGMGCGASPWNRCVMLGTNEYPLYVIILPIIILVAVFGVLKFFAMKTWVLKKE